MALYDYIKINRRYSRSINLERDINISESVKGYILTSKENDYIKRFLESLIQPNSVRCWTISGTYGTGKSSFAHFLSALCAAKDAEISLNAVKILKDSDYYPINLLSNLHDNGLIRALVTAQKEPVANTLIRALKNVSENYLDNVKGVKSTILSDIKKAYNETINGKIIDNNRLLSIVKELSITSKSGLLIIIDELGKNLEYAAQNASSNDLYILQQIAELPSGVNDPKIFFIGLLHQAFYEYAQGLSIASKNEWAKIQGRFENISFSESPDRLFYLIKNAIDYSNADELIPTIEKWSMAWEDMLSRQNIANKIFLKGLHKIYPLHPIAGIALSILCSKFSQNNRTLFTFLSSEEPYSFKTFLKLTNTSSKKENTLKIDQLYDYFIESGSITISANPRYQHWLEIQGRVSEARNLDLDSIKVLKAIGLLNLISGSGVIKASRKIVALSLSENPGDIDLEQYWNNIIDSLIKKGFATWRKQYDELRIWEGSDFDVETLLSEQQLNVKKTSLSVIINEFYPLRPLIPRKHSYKGGTIRFFERKFFDVIPEKIECSRADSDGIICYVLSKENNFNSIPSFTTDKKPIVVIILNKTTTLQTACHEYASLQNISKSANQLQMDGVARREVRQRLFNARRFLENALPLSFNSSNLDLDCWIIGNKESIKNEKELNNKLSKICDSVYCKEPHVWNELINKRELSSQGSKARRELMASLIYNADKERLGIDGYGPVRSLYDSLIRLTGIHKNNNKKWYIDEPNKESGIYSIWKKIEEFCFSATAIPSQIENIYKILEKPPYGAKQGIIPVILLSVLIYHSETISIYIDGSYIPILGTEHVDLLNKRPDKFAVKYFDISGVKSQLFKELEKIITTSVSNKKPIRNASILNIINPLIKFIRNLPQYTQKTQNLSNETKAVRKVLLEAKEPDILLFKDLPQACGFLFPELSSSIDKTQVEDFGKKIVLSLNELKTAYDVMMTNHMHLICKMFFLNQDINELRSYLRAIASRIINNTQVIDLNLKRFIQASMDIRAENQIWLESLFMVISDKPPMSWTDNDMLAFEVKLGETARRLRNIDTIININGNETDEFEARKITITFPSGEEINEVIWLDRKNKEKVEQIADKIIEAGINKDDKLGKAILTAIIEKMFSKKENDEEAVKLKPITKMGEYKKHG